MKQKLTISIITMLCLTLPVAPSQKVASQVEDIQFDSAAYSILKFTPIPKAPAETDPKVAEWWNKSEQFNFVAKQIAEHSKRLVNKIKDLTNNGKKSFSHPEVIKYATELEQIEKVRAELKRRFLAWLREGKENSYQVPLPDGLPRFLLRAEARYTVLAINNRIKGIMSLDMSFHDDGTVDAIKLVSGLPDGLVESAIYAAKLNIFLPCTKDKRFITQRGRIEYEFNMY